MQGKKIEGIQLTEVKIEKLETTILNIKREQTDSFENIQIETSDGEVECRYYWVENADKGVIMVGGVGGGFDTPADSLYPRLCTDLKEAEISSLRIKFRNPTDLAAAVMDVLIGIEFLKLEDIREFGLIGHSFGGAVVVQAAFNEKHVKTIVTLATRGFGISPISLLRENTSVLLIHGENDQVLPPEISVYAYDLAHEPKCIKIFDANSGHSLNEVSDDVYTEVKNWIIENLEDR
jgi:pimeloyl-ACP methyl ester carboxylesterase